MPSLPLDLRFAFRSLARRPGFALTAILTLALGIGATTTIWSFAQGLLWSSLPYPEGDRLVMIWQDYRERGGPEREWFSPPNFHDYRDGNRTFTDMALYNDWVPTVASVIETDGATAETVDGALVSHSYFPTLGIGPVAGRGFTPEDDAPGAPRVVLLREDLAAARSAAVGDTLLVAGEPHTVIGFVPESFRYDDTAGARIWRPLSLDVPAISRGAVFVRAVGRLADGVTLEQARDDLGALAAAIRADHPGQDGVGVAIHPLADERSRDLRPALLTLLAAVAGLLLVAGINVAHLLLARGASRGRELAVRSALGAGRGRLVRQLVLEGVLLAFAGGATGLLVAAFGIDLLRALIPAELVSGLESVTLDPRAALFAFTVALAAGLVAGLLPALALTRRDPERHLRRAIGGGAPDSGQRLGAALVAAETALALVLLVVSGLLMTSFAQLSRVDTGFDARGLATFSVSAPETQFPERAQLLGFYDRLLDRLAELPGVDGVAAASALPLADGNTDTNFLIVGRPPPEPAATPQAWFRQVTPEYLDLLGIRLLRGRHLDATDVRTEVPEGEKRPVVAVVNESLVATYFATEDPLGRELDLGPVVATIVGVAADTRSFGLDRPEPPSLYLALAQAPTPYLDVVVRTDGDPETLLAPMLAALREVDPRVAADDPETLPRRVADSVAPERATTVVGTLFGVAALLLAAVGLYGVVAYATRRRSLEIGLRMALGARAGHVLRMVIGQGLAPVAVGVALGLVGGWITTRWLSPHLYAVEGFEVFPVAGAVMILGLAALTALLVPARRAVRVDPGLILRES